MRYVGIDLAWGNRNTTAVFALEAVPDGAKYYAHADALTDDASITDFVAGCDDGKGLLIAIDAPTVVPNETGRRPCEAVLSRCLRVQEAGPHPANRTLLAGADGTVRGERLVERLVQQLGVVHTPYVTGNEPRAVFEAFPHPAHIALFDLPKTLKYKKKPGRDREYRDGEFRRYAALLAGLAAADPRLSLTPDSFPQLWRDPSELSTEVALKRYEDMLDALTCAYIAAYHHRWHGTRSVVIGDLDSGYIVTPATEDMNRCFFPHSVAVQ